jgi:hypothetical protein
VFGECEGGGKEAEGGPEWVHVAAVAELELPLPWMSRGVWSRSVDVKAMTRADLPGMESLARAPAGAEGGGLGQLGQPLCAHLPRLWTGG